MFISLEGIDGAGKTTIAGELAAALYRRGRRVVFVRKDNPPLVENPETHEELHELARKLYVTWKRKPVYDSLGEIHCILVNASYYALLDTCVITPALRRGDLVLVDGWFYKLVARVLHNRADSPRDALPYFCGIRVPDKVVLLDVPAEVAVTRIDRFTGGETGVNNFGKPGSPEEFIAYQRVIGASLRNLASRHGWEVLDGRELSVAQTVDILHSLVGPSRQPVQAGRADHYGR
jgi:dTMP kinase